MNTSSALRFAVLGELAAGGMARVELARRVDGEGELVAVKRLHRHLSEDTDFVGMFFDEARVTAVLNHPAIVRLVGFGSDENGMFLATEFVEGASLAELFDARRRERERIPPEIAAYVGARVAEGLAAAHALTDASGGSLGIVHRDVSPSNILVGCRGEVKVADFGVARAVFRATQTVAGVLKGKLHYMSPEYVAGQPIDARSDLFSLGVVLYQLVSGRRPFDGDNEPQIMWRIAAATFPALAHTAPDIDPELAAIIENLLRKDPRERTPTGIDLAKLLDGWLLRRGYGPREAARAVSEFVGRYGHAQRGTLGRLLSADLDLRPAELSGSATILMVHPAESRVARSMPSAAMGTRVVRRSLPDAPMPLAAPEPVAVVATEPVRPPRTRVIVVALAAAALTLLLLAVVVGFAIRLKRSSAPPQSETTTESSARAPPEPPAAPAAVEPPAPTTAAPPTAPAAAPTAADAGTPMRSETKERVRTRTAPKPPRTTTTASPARTCTPLDFDYPRCLKD